MVRIALLLVAGLLPAAFSRPFGGRPAPSLKESRLLMGTVVSVEIAGLPRERREEIFNPLWAEAERLEALFSRYQPESELNRINRSAGLGEVKASPEMVEVLILAGEASELSGGAFDATVAPLMEIWGFFPQREGAVPGPEEIEATRRRVDWRAVEVGRDKGVVNLTRPGVEIDLGGIAKGYIVDRLIDFLKGRGVTDALVNAGGDIYCLGQRPGGGPWRIGVEDPDRPGQAVKTLELSDIAVATSGDYQNYFIHDLRRYGHIMDPRTGRPAESPVEAVTVIAPNCALADALATAVFVLGEEEGLKMIEGRKGVEILLILAEDGRLRFRASSGWPGSDKD